MIDTAQVTILVVDDELLNREMLKVLLEEHEIVVLQAGNGREALDQLAAHPETDLVLLDLEMPVTRSGSVSGTGRGRGNRFLITPETASPPASRLTFCRAGIHSSLYGASPASHLAGNSVAGPKSPRIVKE